MIFMTYCLLIKKRAKKALLSLSSLDRKRITEKIVLLGNNPDDSRLDIKPLKGEPYYRLRIGQWRVIFSRDEEVQIISIEKVKPRGGAYK